MIQVVSRYLQGLKKTGNRYTALCPFHSEKTPSFSVSPDKGLYYCYGCHASGNIFTFVSQIEGLSFPESVARVAELSGISIDTTRGDSGKNDYLYRINNYASELFHRFLLSDGGKNGREYLKSRGITEESIVKFTIGYAPDSWDFLYKSLLKKKIKLESAESLGLISVSRKKGSGRYYDRYRNRVMFPIIDSRRNRGFGARVLDDSKPKYINSPESDLFHKSTILYGLDQGIGAIRELKRVIIVEGYLDVIACHQNGIENVVAPLGTALTERHVEKLTRICDEVVLLFDSDDAGQKAAENAIHLLLGSACSTKVARLEQGDPFDLIMNRGMRHFMAVVDSAIDPVEYLLHRTVAGYTTGSDPTVYLKEAFTIIDRVDLETRKDHYLRILAQRLNLDSNLVIKDYRNLQGSGTQTRSHREDALPRPLASNMGTNFRKKSYMDLLSLLVINPGLMERAVLDFSFQDTGDPALTGIFTTLLEMFRDNGELQPDKLFDIFDHGAELDILKECTSVVFQEVMSEDIYTEVYINLRLYEINQKISTYATQIKNGDSTQNLITEIEVLRREEEKLSHYLYNKGIKNRLPGQAS